MTRSHYDRHALAVALAQVGLRKGDVVFSHSNVGFFGVPAEGGAADIVATVVYGAFRDVIGAEGTLVAPTFTNSFDRGEVFDPSNTPSQMGLFAEYIRCRPDAVRSHDGIHSVAAIGPLAQALATDVSDDAFGPDSFFDRFQQAGGKICNLNFDAASTFIHFVERKLNVPYRYPKAFAGTLRVGGADRPHRSVMFAREHASEGAETHLPTFHHLAKERGLALEAKVGRGSVVCISAADTERLIAETLPSRPWFLTTAETRGVVPRTDPVVGPGRVAVPSLDGTASTIADALTPLQRQGVTAGVEAALAAIATIVPLEIRRLRTGTPLGNGWVPERWQAIEGMISVAGREVANLIVAPGLVAAHSRPFEGCVDMPTFRLHVFYNRDMPGRRPHADVVDQNRWAVALTPEELDSLGTGPVDVKIRVQNQLGALAFGIVRGTSRELLPVDLGQNDADEVARAVAAWVTMRTTGNTPTVGLLIHPRPFRAADLPTEFALRTPRLPQGASVDFVRNLEAELVPANG